MKLKMGSFIKRLTSIVLLFVLLLQPLCCLDFYSSQAQSNLTNLEQLMTDLQNNSIEQQILVQNLQDSLATAETQLGNAESTVQTLTKSLEEASVMQEKQSKLLKKQDTMLCVLKWSLGLSIPIAFTTGLIVGYKMKR